MPDGIEPGRRDIDSSTGSNIHAEAGQMSFSKNKVSLYLVRWSIGPVPMPSPGRDSIFVLREWSLADAHSAVTRPGRPVVAMSVPLPKSRRRGPGAGSRGTEANFQVNENYLHSGHRHS